MGKKSSSAPKPPDPVSTASAQGALNKETANAIAKNSAINQYTPYGSITYKRDKNGVPTAATQKLTPAAQTILNNQMKGAGLTTAAAAKLATQLPTTPMSTNGVAYDPSKYGSNIVADFEATNLPYDPKTYGNNLVPNYEAVDAPFDPRSYGDMESYTNDAGDAYFSQAWSRLAPAQEQEFDRRTQWLADQGLPVGSKAWNTSYGEMAREQADARSSIANQAALISGQEAQRRLNMEQSVRNAAFTENQADYAASSKAAQDEIAQQQALRQTALNQDLAIHQQQNADKANEIQTQQQLRNQIIQEMLTGRNQNLNELSALLTGQGALQMPQQVGGVNYNMATPDLAGLIQGGYQNQMAAYNQNQQNASNTWQTAASAAGTLLPLMKCSRDYKYDDAPAERILDLAARIPVRTWKYKDENVVHIGPYAEDWQRITGLGNGKEISVVDAFGVCLKSIQDLKDDVDSLKRRVA